MSLLAHSFSGCRHQCRYKIKICVRFICADCFYDKLEPSIAYELFGEGYIDVVLKGRNWKQPPVREAGSQRRLTDAKNTYSCRRRGLITEAQCSYWRGCPHSLHDYGYKEGDFSETWWEKKKKKKVWARPDVLIEMFLLWRWELEISQLSAPLRRIILTYL